MLIRFPFSAAYLKATWQRNPEHSDVQMLIWELTACEGLSCGRTSCNASWAIWAAFKGQCWQGYVLP